MLRRLKIWFRLDDDVGSGCEGKLDDIAGKILIIAKSGPVVLLSLHIPEIHVYSATRPPWNKNVRHLKLKEILQIAEMLLWK
ncbi:MAG TPA: hypothetical protein DCR61_04885 [Verrucomicrobiales bacterium]|nr:hypothetical protein [Verrucomicrobiales bacterium]